MFRLELGFVLIEDGAVKDMVLVFQGGFLIGGGRILHHLHLSLFFNMERVGGCCCLNYALKSLRLPRMDISLYLVSIKITVVFMKYAPV